MQRKGRRINWKSFRMPFVILKSAAIKISPFSSKESKRIGDATNQGLEIEEKFKVTAFFNIVKNETKEVIRKENLMNCKIQSF